MERRPFAAVLAASLAFSCSYPQFTSSKVVELELPATDVQTLVCETHNGGITVNGDAKVANIKLRAEMSVRGATQEEADANLNLLEIGQEASTGKLRLWGKYPAAELVNRSPSFAFTLEVPKRLALDLESHNGSLKLSTIDGNIALRTHNGDIDGNVRSATCAAETHNGSVELQFGGTGDVAGSIKTHNGSVVATFADGRRTNIAADTHNGRIDPGTRLREARASRRELRGRLGAENTESTLTVVTHNGNVDIR
jgi:DUF4097 and DUF4098 domain-containing protein YvlB